jgi:hypothetical protein
MRYFMMTIPKQQAAWTGGSAAAEIGRRARLAIQSEREILL